MRFATSLFLTAVASLALTACGSGGSSQGSRDFVRAVGSSTLYPFSTAIAEQTAKAGFKSPVIEATGTGAGMKLFCAGVGAKHPDVENASRRIKLSEFEECQKNGVTDIVEIQVGLDGIAFAGAVNGPADLKLTPEDVYKALAANPYGKPNTAKTWKDVNPALPDLPILVYGPPSTSGTRDALAELILAKGCDSNPEMKALKASDDAQHKKVCTEVRSDGAYVDAGENDNLIVQKLAENPRAVGVFGFSYLEANTDKLRGIPMNSVVPTYETVSSFEYPGARPLYIYVKAAHLEAIRGLREYVQEWEKAWGSQGLLQSKGMVISPEADRVKNADVVANMTLLDGAQLK